MSADAEPASGLFPEPQWSRGTIGDESHSLLSRPTPNSAETTGEPELDRLPFGLSFRSSAPTQTAYLSRNGLSGRVFHPHFTLTGLVEPLRIQINRLFADQVTPVRLASHLSVLAVAALILLLTQVNIPEWDFSLRLLPNSGMLGNSAIGGDAATPVTVFASRAGGDLITGEESLERAAIPFTIIRQAPVVDQIQSYVVQAGDTVLAIAQKFGLQPETIQWSNSGLEINADLIRPGDQLQILPFDGAIHIVAPGDTLSSLAEEYSVTITDITGYPGNGLADTAAPLVVGQQLVVPHGVKSVAAQQYFGYTGGGVPSTAKLGSGNFGWPTSGSINQPYWGGHPGVDIGAWTGAPVAAADGGYVALATGGWNGGYGNHVIIDHGNGFVTLYAHLNSIYVRGGENVVRGQQIGSVGNTGNSTGPHLHFEIRYQGSPQNPLSYLP